LLLQPSSIDRGKPGFAFCLRFMQIAFWQDFGVTQRTGLELDAPLAILSKPAPKRSILDLRSWL
jgi:hypothetical protein